LQYHLLADDYRIAEATIALENFRDNWPNENPHDAQLARNYAILGRYDEAMALDPASKARIASALGQRDFALSAMEEEAARRTDPHDRADVYWYTYMNLGMYDEALEVLSDLWYGYAAEDIGPKMDPGDVFNFVVLLRHADREDEAAPIAEQLIEITAADDEDTTAWTRMMEGDYEDALRLYIERAKNGKPPIDFVGLNKRLFVLQSFPEYATLERLVAEWIEEQRTLYDELTAGRALASDAASL